MQFKHVASSVAALAMLGLASASQPAAAHGHGGHGHPGGGGWAPHHAAVGAFAGPHHLAFHRVRHHRRFVFVGAYPYYYPYDVDDGCTWLGRRARLTGSPYWWHRYYACRDGYDD
jgi:hypothetical protein